MKRMAIISLAIILTGSAYFGATVLAERAEMEAAAVPLKNYLMGHKTGKAEYMKKAFHSEGKLIFIRGGKYSTIEFENYIGRMRGVPAKDEAERKRWIESIEVSGDAAVGKIILDYPSARYVDYMSMLKIDGEWKIVNKTFTVKRK